MPQSLIMRNPSLRKPSQSTMSQKKPSSPDPASSSLRSTEGEKPDSEPRVGSSSPAGVPSATGCAFWGKVWHYGAKIHQGEHGDWLSWAMYIRQPNDSMMTCFVNWMDYTWIPEKGGLVICQGIPILRTGENGVPFLVLRCYGSKGVRKAQNTRVH